MKTNVNLTIFIFLMFNIGINEQVLANESINSNYEAGSPEEHSNDSINSDDVNIQTHDALFMLDYQDIKLPGKQRIDLIGYHFLTPINDWAYFGIGGYAPLLHGNYGGFMAFGGLLHAQAPIYQQLFVNGGVSFGGGGGGESIQQSKEFSGTGGYLRGYFGLGYEFEDFSAGANISHMTFFNSVIDNTQLNLFVEVPFSFTTSPYGDTGNLFSSINLQRNTDDEYIFSLGLDNYKQIDPIGSYKGVINVVDFQFSDFISKHSYWYYSAAVGYRGIPIYNQIILGLGGRVPLSDSFQLYGQLGVGSGGYAPELIDTGSGLLLYPKFSVEYLVNDNLGLALTTGYLLALDGTSKNFTMGLAINQHFGTNVAKDNDEGQYNGYRIKLSHETLTNLNFRNKPLSNLNMLTFQADKLFTKHIYLPLRIAVAYQSYRGYPGYGEVSTGIGVQTGYTRGDKFQLFSELQIGANVEGAIIRPSIGIDFSFNEDLAFHTALGYTVGNENFNSVSIELGLSRRFSLMDF